MARTLRRRPDCGPCSTCGKPHRCPIPPLPAAAPGAAALFCNAGIPTARPSAAHSGGSTAAARARPRSSGGWRTLTPSRAAPRRSRITFGAAEPCIASGDRERFARWSRKLTWLVFGGGLPGTFGSIKAARRGGYSFCSCEQDGILHEAFQRFSRIIYYATMARRAQIGSRWSSRTNCRCASTIGFAPHGARRSEPPAGGRFRVVPEAHCAMRFRRSRGARSRWWSKLKFSLRNENWLKLRTNRRRLASGRREVSSPPPRPPRWPHG